MNVLDGWMCAVWSSIICIGDSVVKSLSPLVDDFSLRFFFVFVFVVFVFFLKERVSNEVNDANDDNDNDNEKILKNSRSPWLCRMHI